MRALTNKVVACAVLIVVAKPANAQLIINMTPDATLAANPAAIAAFNRAALEWSSVLTNPVTLNISAGMSTLSNPSDTGFTTPGFLTGTYATVRNKLVANAAGNSALTIVSSLPTTPTFNLPAAFSYSGNVVLTRANAKALGFSVASGTDATIAFNSSFAFTYNNTNGVAPGTIDFQTIAAHEIGHALGFVSAVDVVDGSSSGAISPNPLDLYRFRNLPGQSPTTAAQFSTLARNLIPGNDDVFSDAQLSLRMSTGSSQGDGRGAGHWKDDALTGNYIGIMDPSVLAGTSESLTSSDIRAMELIGWTVSPVPEPSSMFSICLIAAGIAGCVRRRRPSVPPLF